MDAYVLHVNTNTTHTHTHTRFTLDYCLSEKRLRLNSSMMMHHRPDCPVLSPILRLLIKLEELWMPY